MPIKNHDIDLVVAATNTLLQDLSKHITVDDMLKLTYMHRHKLQALFREHYGTTVVAYFVFQKMVRATRLLKETRKTEKEIAISLGYQAPNFISAFKKHLGCTPGEYRKGAFMRAC